MPAEKSERRVDEVLPGVVGRSGVMQSLARLVERSAGRAMPVLLRGESGTGKELVARALHSLSDRDGPFVALNAATLTDDLGGSAFFGHERGAFTGADARRQGAFRRADGGTLFIDEVASLSPRLQAALLRVLEEGLVWPVGGDRPIDVTVRVVSATCEPLDAMVRRGAFRHDLLERLSACVISLPPLRVRAGDLPLLVRRFEDHPALEGCCVTPAALDELCALPLLGNVRELFNLLVQASLLAEDGVIGREAIREAAIARRGGPLPSELTAARAEALLSACGGNVSLAARRAGLPRTTFRDRLKAAQDEPPVDPGVGAQVKKARGKVVAVAGRRRSEAAAEAEALRVGRDHRREAEVA
ncbi:MAG: sigma 54-interacting transcriptional regulator [Polyangiaceae bacterium]